MPTLVSLAGRNVNAIRVPGQAPDSPTAEYIYVGQSFRYMCKVGLETCLTVRDTNCRVGGLSPQRRALYRSGVRAGRDPHPAGPERHLSLQGKSG